MSNILNLHPESVLIEYIVQTGSSKLIREDNALWISRTEGEIRKVSYVDDDYSYVVIHPTQVRCFYNQNGVEQSFILQEFIDATDKESIIDYDTMLSRVNYLVLKDKALKAPSNTTKVS